MKRKLNKLVQRIILNKYAFFLPIIYFISCSEKNNLRNIGDISTSLDEPGFVVCNERRILEYYNFSNAIQFVGEKPAIDKYIRQNVKYTTSLCENGYITLKFIVNCEGQAGRFKVIQLDSVYKEKHFDPKLVKLILTATKSLNGWGLGKKHGVIYDYYQYLTFKITDSRIENILP